MNYTERIKAIGRSDATMQEKTVLLDNIVDEILNENERLWAINRRVIGYSTWKVTLWLNSSAFGQELAERVERNYIITHDEDKEFTPEDFRDRVEEEVFDLAF